MSNEITIDVQEFSDTADIQPAAEVTSIIEQALDAAGYKSRTRNKTWHAGGGRMIGFEITIEDGPQ